MNHNQFAYKSQILIVVNRNCGRLQQKATQRMRLVANCKDKSKKCEFITSMQKYQTQTDNDKLASNTKKNNVRNNLLLTTARGTK